MKVRWPKIRPKTIVIHVVAWGVALAWIIPFLGVLSTATRPATEVTFGWWQLDPYHPTLDNFIKALTQPTYSVSKGYLNSLIIAVPGTVIPLFVLWRSAERRTPPRTQPAAAIAGAGS